MSCRDIRHCPETCLRTVNLAPCSPWLLAFLPELYSDSSNEGEDLEEQKAFSLAACCAFQFLPRELGAFRLAPERCPATGTRTRVRNQGKPRRFHVSAAPAFSAEDLAAPPSNKWLKIGGSLLNQNYSPLKQINRENVARLKAVWQTHLDGSGLANKYSGEAQPVVYEGVLYIVTGADDVFAVSVKTGEILWKYQANLDQSISTVCCGWTSRGVALGDGNVYVGQLDGRLVALDQKSGKTGLVDSSRAMAGGLHHHRRSAVLRRHGDRRLRGRRTRRRGPRQSLRRQRRAPDLDVLHDSRVRAKSGMTPGRKIATPGSTAARQSGRLRPWIRSWACSTSPPAIPGPDFNGKIRRGDNLFATSMVAIEAKTGKYRWHFQQVHHDLWDYDGPNPVMLFDVKVGGRVRKAAAEASKAGWVYILDRTNGKPLIGIDEKPVPQEPRQFTSPTQPFPRGDAFVPQSIDIAPEGFTLVNQGPDLHAVLVRWSRR